MTTHLKPWVYGPFEVLLHAETHFRSTGDDDRRIAMIGFDNAIEVAVTTYLSLHPIHRGNRTYPRVDVDNWLGNFHTKVEFFFDECTSRSVAVAAEHAEIIWYHEVRNGQYHGGGATIPQRRALEGVRLAALEVFSVLFDEPDILVALEEHIVAMGPVPAPPRSDEHDRCLDRAFGMIEVCGATTYSSEVLYALDPIRYRELALELLGNSDELDDAGESL